MAENKTLPKRALAPERIYILFEALINGLWSQSLL